MIISDITSESYIIRCNRVGDSFRRDSSSYSISCSDIVKSLSENVDNNRGGFNYNGKKS